MASSVLHPLLQSPQKSLGFNPCLRVMKAMTPNWLTVLRPLTTFFLCIVASWREGCLWVMKAMCWGSEVCVGPAARRRCPASSLVSTLNPNTLNTKTLNTNTPSLPWSCTQEKVSSFFSGQYTKPYPPGPELPGFQCRTTALRTDRPHRSINAKQ